MRFSSRMLAAQCDGFLRSLRTKRPDTRGTYQRALREFLKWAGRTPHFRFRVQDVERYKGYLTDEKRLAEVSVSTYLTAVRRFCDYLVNRKILQDNPAKQVGGNRRPAAHTREVLQPDDIARLLDCVSRTGGPGQRDYAIVRLMLDCGLSEIEIVRANVDDLRSDGDRHHLAVQGKGRATKDEAVVLSHDAAEALKSYLGGRGRSHGPLFTSASNRVSGRRLSTRAVRERVTHYLEASGVRNGQRRGISPYSLRHTAAVMLARGGATAAEIRQRMRLGSEATAMIYLNQNND